MARAVRQIPRSLLPFAALVRVPDPASEYGGEHLAPVELRGVRFVAVWELRRQDALLSDGAKGVLYVDAANTQGAFRVPEGSLVSVDGGESWMSVEECREYEAFAGRVHHWELVLR